MDPVVELSRTIMETVTRLTGLAVDDLEGAAWPSAAGGPSVSTSTVSDPTGSARLTWAGDHQAVVRVFKKVVDDLAKAEHRMCRALSGETCPTAVRDEHGRLVQCPSPVSHYGTGTGRCERCDQWYRGNRGFDPPPGWVKAASERQVTMCGCPDWCCPRDADDHTACPDRAAAGRSFSERCKKRMFRFQERRSA